MLIDTDKYEGHEPAPWKYSPDSGCILAPQREDTGNWPILVELPETACLIDGEWKVSKRIPNAKRGQRMFEWVKIEDYTDAYGTPQSVWWGDRLPVLPPTHRLMADAPLLLAEVKRLRGIIDYIRDTGRMVKPKRYSGFFLSIMEKVLTTEEYLEWRNKE